jgi:creatinine amidohydrolase/Fe(II)-dependent formamide hydrolase-like protein
MHTARYEEMRPRELAAALERVPLAYFPIGSLETSAMLHLRPGLVTMERLNEPGALHAIGTNAVEATAAAGRERFEVCVDELVRLVQEERQRL